MLFGWRAFFYCLTFCSFLSAGQPPCKPISDRCPNSKYLNQKWSNPECITSIFLGKSSGQPISSQQITHCIGKNKTFRPLFSGFHTDGTLYLNAEPFSGLFSDGKRYKNGIDVSSSSGEFQWEIIDGETGTGIIRDWPNIPPHFQIPDYSSFAKTTYDLTFVDKGSTNKDGKEVLAHMRWADQEKYPQGQPATVGLEPLFKFRTFFLNSFFDDNRSKTAPWSSESMAILPGLVSAALISKGNTETPRRSEVAAYVRMMKRYFHPLTLTGKPKAGWFGNNPQRGAGNGGSFWYDLGPNIYAMQLLELFKAEEIEPESRGNQATEITFDELCHRMADTLVDMVNFLKDTESGKPSFDYQSVKIKDGRFLAYDGDCSDNRPNAQTKLSREKVFCPVDFWSVYPRCKNPRNDKENPPPWFCFDNEASYEPDAAGAFAYIGLMAFERWKDPKYFGMADSAIQFLLEYDRNPVYELLYNYGVLAAARMNQKYGKNYDIRKLMKYAFVRSDRRIDPADETTFPNYSTNPRLNVGVINEMWGSYPAYGLWGGKGPNWGYGGYAFYMNSISQPIVLAPLLKHYPNYATLFGKYLLHVASNSQFFFSDFVPDELEDPKTLNALTNRLDHRYRSIPYEGLRKNVTKNGTTIRLKGDAVQEGWAETDLSIYSGSLTGTFAAMMIKDSNDSSAKNPIVFWDLNVTDFSPEKGYPYYLVFNPTNSKKTVKLKREAIRSIGDLDFSGNGNIAVWDLILNKWLSNTTDDVSLELEAGQASVFALVPPGHSCFIENKRVRCYLDSAKSKFYSVLDYFVP